MRGERSERSERREGREGREGGCTHQRRRAEPELADRTDHSRHEPRRQPCGPAAVLPTGELVELRPGAAVLLLLLLQLHETAPAPTANGRRLGRLGPVELHGLQQIGRGVQPRPAAVALPRAAGQAGQRRGGRPARAVQRLPGALVGRERCEGRRALHLGHFSTVSSADALSRLLLKRPLK